MKIHLIAVCGTGMASLAGLLKEKGYEVTGSDQNVYPPMSDQLTAMGVNVLTGYKAENLDVAKPDLVVVGNAISQDNVEVLEVQKRGLTLLSMPQAIAELFLENKFPSWWPARTARRPRPRCCPGCWKEAANPLPSSWAGS
jgi:UDP-N-acetylmuramate: L-alanyl-gamma-D-glutamyl-meso-diaminopimelate ligase